MFDESTPREAWAEYEQRKRALDLTGADYVEACDQLAYELGLGIAPDELSPAQRAEQARAIARHKGSACEP